MDTREQGQHVAGALVAAGPGPLSAAPGQPGRRCARGVWSEPPEQVQCRCRVVHGVAYLV